MGLMKECVQNTPVTASAPCRLDMGGTLDLSTFYLPLHYLEPCTFNAALDMRTYIRLEAHDNDRLLINSRGFDSVEVDLRQAPFDHPMGLMLAVAAYFQAEGIRILIDSTSPPRSALGGSSVAAVALIWALSKALSKTGRAMPEPGAVASLAHALEQSVAGVPCGLQDQLAAAFGSVHAWHWSADPLAPYRRQTFSDDRIAEFSERMLVAYCGLPHASIEINGAWVRGFIAGCSRTHWIQIAALGQQFVRALYLGDFQEAQTAMNQETDLRIELTPQVLDDMGRQLVAAARDHGCGARFTGAGGGGCIWALGVSRKQIQELRTIWQAKLSGLADARILDTTVDRSGIL